MNRLLVNILAAAAIVAAPAAWATPVTYAFSGEATTGARAGSMYSGSFTFDDAGPFLGAFPFQAVDVGAFSMVWTGLFGTETFGLVNVDVDAAIIAGEFAGLSGSSRVGAPVSVPFNFIAGIPGLIAPAFTYDGNGAGSVTYVESPAPATASLLLAGGALLFARRRRGALARRA